MTSSWPWGGQGCQQKSGAYCKQVGLEDLNVKMQDKDVIEEAVFYHNYSEMKEDMLKYKKLDQI